MSVSDEPLDAILPPLIPTDDLQKLSTRFYIYDDPAITQSSRIHALRHLGKEAYQEPAQLDHVISDTQAERDVLEALKKHPLRTTNPRNATVFVIPTPITELLAYGCQWEECTWYDEAFDALLSHPVYKRTKGHNHVLISFNWLSFNKRMAGFIPSLSRNYRRIENVTVANHYDPFGCLELTEQMQDSYDETETDFAYLFPEELPVTKSFSVGLGGNSAMEIQEATYEKFLDSRNFLFYHSRGPEQPFAYGSTKYRMAPLNETVIDALPQSSIGFDISGEEWNREFSSSKFCLVVRGDTPHSHALLRAVRAGCIPVIVSDAYETYAGTFKSSLSLEDYSIILDEEKVLLDPASEIGTLLDISEDEIKGKLRNLTIAQSIALPDHPGSLFVQAFLKETMAVDQRLVPDIYTRVPYQVGTSIQVISGNEYTYHYPSNSFLSSPEEDGPTLITGVLSAAWNRNRRQAIRDTWAKHYRNPMRVFFVVAGSWEEIEEEFVEHGDLLWLDAEEDVASVTYKTQMFFAAVDTHFERYDYIFKTHDDAYVGVHEIHDIIREYEPHYWGHCVDEVTLRTPDRDSSHLRYVSQDAYSQDLYPTWASEEGYLLSAHFNACAVSLLEDSPFIPMDGVSTGILAEKCHIGCVSDGWEWWKDDDPDKQLVVVSHPLQSKDMISVDWKEDWKEGRN